MKLSKYILAIAALTVAFTLSAKADLQFLRAVNFGNGPNDPGTNHDVLEAFLGFDPGALSNDFSAGELSGPVTVTDGEFFVVHYGKGKGGSSKGGGLEFYQVINGETNVTVPGTGNVGGNDPFGHGGISSIREFCPPDHNMPDSGTTAMLLGSAITGLGLVRRYLKR